MTSDDPLNLMRVMPPEGARSPSFQPCVSAHGFFIDSEFCMNLSAAEGPRQFHPALPLL